MCIFVFYIMYKRCYNKNNNKVETLSTLKSKNKQQEEKTMRIHEMHEAYVKRNWEHVKQHNENLDELKMRITEVVTSFKEAADKIPEDVIYRAIDSVMGSEEDDCFYDCWMIFSIENDEISYDLGDNVAGKVQDDETIKEVHKLTQFFYLANKFLKILTILHPAQTFTQKPKFRASKQSALNLIFYPLPKAIASIERS